MRFLQRHASLALSAALALTVAGSPIVINPDIVDIPNTSPKTSQGFDADALKNKDKWCDTGDGLQYEKNAKAVIDRVGLGETIQSFIAKENNWKPHAWLEKFEPFVYPEHKDDFEESKIGTCAALGAQECDAGRGTTCKKTFNAGNDQQKRAWWVFKAVQGASSAMRALSTKLDRETIVNSLELPAIAEAFEEVKDDDEISLGNIPAWLSSALGIVGTVSGLSDKLTGVGVSAGLIGSALDLVQGEDEVEETTISLANVQDGLANVLTATTVGLERTLKAAMGRADVEDDYNRLPRFSETGFRNPISNFFNDAFWLLDADSQVITEAYKAIFRPLRLRMIDQVLQQAGYVIVIDEQMRPSRNECEKLGRYWMKEGDKEKCIGIWQPKGDEWREVPDDSDLFAKMKTYGIDSPHAYIVNSMQCAKSSCGKAQSLDIGNIKTDELPLCHFSMPVKKMFRQAPDGIAGEFDYLFSDWVEKGDEKDCPPPEVSKGIPYEAFRAFTKKLDGKPAINV